MSEKPTTEFDEKTRNALAELLSLTRNMQDYANDQVLQDLSKLLGALFKLLNVISSTDLIDVLERGLQDPELDKALLNPPRIGAIGMLTVRDEDFERGLGILVELIRAIGKASRSQ
jgi:uncharacterized protein YjgD (DUF1641 family)